MRLAEVQSLPTPNGLRALADDYADDAASPGGIVGLLRIAAGEISLSREEIKRLAAVLKTITEERDVLSGGMGPGNWPNDSEASEKLRVFRDDRVRQDRDRWRSKYQDQKGRADRLADRLASAEAIVQEVGALLPGDGEALSPPLLARVRELLGDLVRPTDIDQAK